MDQTYFMQGFLDGMEKVAISQGKRLGELTGGIIGRTLFSPWAKQVGEITKKKTDEIFGSVPAGYIKGEYAPGMFTKAFPKGNLWQKVKNTGKIVKTLITKKL